MTTITKQSYDVIIVGAGPCGVTAANMLGQSGVSTLVIDKEAGIVTIPRAVGICEGGSRIIDSIGVLDDPEMEFRQINSVHFRNKKQDSVFHADLYAPENGHRLLRTFHQPDLEKSIRRSLNAYDCVELATSTKMLEFKDHGHSVEVKVKQDETTLNISGRYLLACDGASSPIRKKLDIGFTGGTYPQEWMILDVEKNPQSSSEVIFCIDPERPSVTLPGPGNKRRWEFVVKKDDDPEKLFERDNLAKLLGDWGNVEDMEISRKAVYTFHARTAEKYQLGNVFLLGDSAHITPPFAGQGMMAGLRDAHNLCWKISAVLKKELSPRVLETYQVERIPQSRQVIKFAQYMGDIILPQNPTVAKVRDGVIKILGVMGLHSDTKGVPIDKIPNHINGGYIKHMLIGKLFKTGFELPQYLLKKNDQSILADKLLGDSFYLLGWNVNPEKYLEQETLQRWKSMAGKNATFASKLNGNKNLNDMLLVNEGEEYKRVFKAGKRVLVIRPDKMMVVNCSLKSLNRKLNKYMDQIGCIQ